MRLAALLRRAGRRLARARLHFGHGTDNARDEAAFLVLRGLGLGFDADPARPVDAADAARVASLIERRIRERAPAAYLLGEAWLDGVRFEVGPGTIVPRSFIAELLRERLAPWLARPPRRVLDLCTGSGCLAVLAARAFPRAHVDATDLSVAALAIARRNVARHRLRRRVRVLRSDLFGALRGRRYDLILCNPPYVGTAALRRLPPEYRHEPRVALAGGRDGLDLVRRLLREAARHLEPAGLLVCEVGDGRRALERACPRLELTWPQTSAGPERVFVIGREQLTRTGARARTRATRRPAR